MTKVVSGLITLLICVIVFCDSVHCWGWHFGGDTQGRGHGGYGGYDGGDYGYNHHHHQHNNRHNQYNQPNYNNPGSNFNDRVGVATAPVSHQTQGPSSPAVDTILDNSLNVGRFRRQNSSIEFSNNNSNGSEPTNNGEARLNNNNMNTCRVENNRVLGRWRCDNGEIIDCSGLCNGRRDCADRSDETVISCRHVFCLDSAFRCSYGGCIRSELECNGVQDCADGSDEKTINCPGVLNKIRANGNCEEGFFQCKSGQCVYDDGVCSGGAECSDGSDETAAVCSTHFCPEPAFRCDYGACVPRMARCNGKMDCVDGSDERPEMCGNITAEIMARPSTSPSSPPRIPSAIMSTLLASTSPSNAATIVTQFRELLFRQESQISELRQENLQLRLTLLDSVGGNFPALPDLSSRPTLALDPTSSAGRCDPVAIPPPAARPTLAGNRQQPIAPPALAPTRPGGVQQQPIATPAVPTSRPSGVQTPMAPIIPIASTPAPPPIPTGPREEGDCDAPLLQGGRVSDVFGRRYDNRVVKNGEEIIFECLAGTSLIGANSTYCINGNLLRELPLCTNQCSGLPLNTLSVQAECFEPTGTKIPCSPLLPPKTIAILSCKVGYKRPDRIVPDAYTCMDDGNWNAHVYKCMPICGEVSEGRRLIVGGMDSNITQVPWHAGIYESIENRMEQICGGSIINPTAIVTAAHCFWDQQRKAMKAAELYRVAVGKTLRDFNADEPTSQRYAVSSIKIYDQYMDYEGLYVSDIAVILLDKPIIFQSYIKPICVEYSLKGNQRYVVSGITGRVAGWGLTASEGESSPVLKTIDLPTVDFNTCLNESPASFKPFITTDKFCGGFTSGESVCRGDSGGGLAFPKPSEDKLTTVYFLRGIVSVGPILKGSCDNTKYSAFTDIQLHNLFLYDYLFV